MNNSSVIIGFGHKARQGKDTAVHEIVNAFKNKDGIIVKQYSFAEALKKEVLGREKELCALHNIEFDENPDMTDPICNGPYGKQRKLLQWYGTQFRRAQNKYHWIEKVAYQIDLDFSIIKQKNPNTNIKFFALVSDLRFKNEFEWVKTTGGFTVKVERISDVPLELNNSDHDSENDLNDAKFDYVISAKEGELTKLKSNALEVFDSINQLLYPENNE